VCSREKQDELVAKAARVDVAALREEALEDTEGHLSEVEMEEDAFHKHREVRAWEADNEVDKASLGAGDMDP
jgi:hypothetical protein